MKHELLDVYFLCRVLDVMETIDDDCDDMDVVFVAVKVQLIFIPIISFWYWSLHVQFCSKDKALSAKYNIDEFPTLMFFKNQIPSIYDEDLERPGEVLTWLNDLLTGADIEQVNVIRYKLE